MTAADVAATSVTNTAYGTGSFDGNTVTSNADSVMVSHKVANLSVTKTDSPDPVLVGDDVTYTITVSNAGPDTATKVGLNDPIPANSTFDSATPSQGTCPDTTVNCNLGSILSGGSATVTIVVTANAEGTLVNTASVQAAQRDLAIANNSDTELTTVNLRPTTLTYTGSTTSDFHDAAIVSAHLVDTTTGDPIAGVLITFVLNGTESCSDETDASGNASCSITPNEPQGTYTLTADFAGDTTYEPSSVSTPFIVTREQTETTYTGPTGAVVNGSTVTLSGVLEEDGVTPIEGRTLTLTLGTQSCSGLTNASGSFSCTIVVSQPTGPATASATFLGDNFYLPSSDTEAVITASNVGNGAFVIGNNNAAMGSSVYFWGSQWSSKNSLTGGTAPLGLQGLRQEPFQPIVRKHLGSTDPGNSAPPPAGPLPAYITVIVTDKATKSGSQTSGKIKKIVVVKINPGYSNNHGNPGHAGTGTVVAVIC